EAVDDLQARTEDLAEQSRVARRERPLTGGSDRDLARAQIFDRSDRHRVPDREQTGVRAGRSQPGELQRIIRDTGAEQRFERSGVLQETDGTAVLLGRAV